MKILIIFALSITIALNTVNSQTLRHIQDWNMIKFGTGITPESNYFYGGYNHFFTKKLFIAAEANYFKGIIGRTNYEVITGGSDINYTFIKTLNDRLFVNVNSGLFIGSEKISAEQFGTKNKFIYGLTGGLNTEIFIVRRVALELFARQYLTFNSNVGMWTSLAGVGLKFSIN